jgi:hypothetical protein
MSIRKISLAVFFLLATNIFAMEDESSNLNNLNLNHYLEFNQVVSAGKFKSVNLDALKPVLKNSRQSDIQVISFDEVYRGWSHFHYVNPKSVIVRDLPKNNFNENYLMLEDDFKKLGSDFSCQFEKIASHQGILWIKRDNSAELLNDFFTGLLWRFSPGRK